MIVLFLLVATFLFFLCFIMPKERFPRWLFGILCAWWWPKPETPATLLAVTVDCMTDDMIDRGWTAVPRRYDEGYDLQSPILKATVGDYTRNGTISFVFNQTSMTISKWDDYVLAKVSKRVIRVKTQARDSTHLREAAETMLAAAHVIKGEIKQLENRARAAALPPPVSPIEEEHKRRVDEAVDRRLNPPINKHSVW